MTLSIRLRAIFFRDPESNPNIYLCRQIHRGLSAREFPLIYRSKLKNLAILFIRCFWGPLLRLTRHHLKPQRWILRSYFSIPIPILSLLFQSPPKCDLFIPKILFYSNFKMVPAFVTGCKSKRKRNRWRTAYASMEGPPVRNPWNYAVRIEKKDRVLHLISRDTCDVLLSKAHHYLKVP